VDGPERVDQFLLPHLALLEVLDLRQLVPDCAQRGHDRWRGGHGLIPVLDRRADSLGQRREPRDGSLGVRCDRLLRHPDWTRAESNTPDAQHERHAGEEEITRLLDAAAKSRNKELRQAVILALNTGLRLGELLGLTWERVDLSLGVIRLELTKNGRRREIPMNDATYGAFVGLGPKASGRVFKTRYIKTAYNNAVEAVQLDDVTFHTLRHTFASWAVMRGVTLKELQELLGHSSLAMTMRYAHLAPEHLRTAVSRLEGLTTTEPAKVSAQASAQEPVETEGAPQKSLK
jgi:integrase